MRKHFSWALALLALATMPVLAGPLPAGTKAPKIEAPMWFKKGKAAKAPKKTELAGKVIVLEFFAYW